MRNLSLLCVLLGNSLFAIPNGGKVVQGNVDVSNANAQMAIVQQSSSAIIDWDNFSIDSLEAVEFQQPSSTASILNRVVGKDPSVIQGLLKGNGTVYLINENGVLVSPEGVIKTGQFIASTFNVLDSDYLSGEALCFSGDSRAAIVNQGTIEAFEGNIFLVAKNVANAGSLSASEGSVGLAAATDVLLQEKGEQKIFVRVSKAGFLDNRGSIAAANVELRSAKENLYSLAINQEGMIQATGIDQSNGKVVLCSAGGGVVVSGKIEVPSGEVHILGAGITVKNTAVIDASGANGGGTILIGGDLRGANPEIENAKYLHVEKGASLLADAKEAGNGGKVILWGDRKNHFYGSISAQGGNTSGDGGFVEVSSPGSFQFKGDVSTTAAAGKTGTLLLDPSDIVIDNFGGVGMSNPSFPTAAPGTYDPMSSSGSLDVADVIAALGSNNVSVFTSSGAGGSGSVTINRDITWSDNTTLQIIADKMIYLNTVAVTNTFTGSISSWTAVDLRSNVGMTPITGDFDGISLASSSITSAEGNISLVAVGGNAMFDNGIVLENSTISSTGTGTYAATITLQGTTGVGTNSYLNGLLLDQSDNEILSVDGAISLTGISQSTGGYCPGAYLNNSALIQTSGIAPITINGTGNSGGTGAFEASGVIIYGAFVTSASGAITISGTTNSAGIYSPGVIIEEGAIITSTATGISAGPITITGTGGLGTYEGVGVSLDDCIITSIDSPISITGVARGTLDYNPGINIDSGASLQTTGISAATITLNGTPGAGSHSPGTSFEQGSFLDTASATVTVIGGLQFID